MRIAACLVLIIFVLASDSIAAQFRTIVTKGQSAPGLTFPAVFGEFGEAVINERGDVLFAAHTQSGDSGIWLKQGNNISLVASSVMNPPGAGFVPFTDFSNLKLNDNGDVAFRAKAFSDVGIWMGRPGSLKLVALHGKPVAALASDLGYVYHETLNTSFRSFHLDNTGRIAFNSTMQSPKAGFANGFWYGTAEELSLLSGPDGGQANGRNYGRLFVQGVTDDGRLVIEASDMQPFRRDVLIGTPTDFRLIAASDSPPPGLASFSTHVSAASGHGNIILDSSEGLWIVDSNGLSRLVRLGSPVPRGERGQVFRRVSDNRRINDRGEAIFVAESPFDINSIEAIWKGQAGAELEMVAASGQPIPGSPQGTTYGAFPFNSVGLNDLGEMAIVAFVRNSNGSQGYGLVSINADGETQPILFE